MSPGAVILGGARTPFVRAWGVLGKIPAWDLGRIAAAVSFIIGGLGSVGGCFIGALLVAPDGQTVLLEQGNVSAVEHAEAVLARLMRCPRR